MTLRVINFADGFTSENVPVADDVQAHIDNPTDAHDASAISYDNTDSELVADDVQAAIDEIELRVDTAEADIQAIEDSIGAASGIAPLNASSKIDALYLPSYVDDVLEYADLISFPLVGEDGKIYVAIDTNRTYRWTGTVYVEISASAVISVNGQNNVVVLDADDIAETSTRYWSKKNNVSTSDPTINADSGLNYVIGSVWYNVTDDKVFICKNASIGNAVWSEIGNDPLALNDLTDVDTTGVINGDVLTYSGGSWVAQTPAASSSGGGGSFIWGFSNELPPIQEIINRFNVYSFGNIDTQEIVATINVPSTYVSGQILIENLKVIGSGAGNGLIRAQSFLFKNNELTSVSNSYTSTNAELTFTATNQIKSIELDVCDSSYNINSIPVEANDLILVRLYRAFSAETSPINKVSVLQSAASIRFDGQPTPPITSFTRTFNTPQELYENLYSASIISPNLEMISDGSPTGSEYSLTLLSVGLNTAVSQNYTVEIDVTSHSGANPPPPTLFNHLEIILAMNSVLALPIELGDGSTPTTYTTNISALMAGGDFVLRLNGDAGNYINISEIRIFEV